MANVEALGARFLAGVLLGAILGAVSTYLALPAKPAQKIMKGKAAASGVVRPVPVLRPKEELKLVLCVNNSLKMGKGKIGAQCAHAAVGVVEKYKAHNDTIFKQWALMGQAKIALKIDSEAEMAVLEQSALAAGLPTYIVHDAGRTQIAAGSQTVLAIGPGYKSDINRITGHLALL